MWGEHEIAYQSPARQGIQWKRGPATKCVRKPSAQQPRPTPSDLPFPSKLWGRMVRTTHVAPAHARGSFCPLAASSMAAPCGLYILHGKTSTTEMPLISVWNDWQSARGRCHSTSTGQLKDACTAHTYATTPSAGRPSCKCSCPIKFSPVLSHGKAGACKLPGEPLQRLVSRRALQA